VQVTSDMRFHAISAKMDSAADSVESPLVLQFSVKHEKKDYAFCGGGYIKLLGDVKAEEFGGDTPYSIMFGPDLCGYDVSRIHAIFSHGGENLLKTEDIKLDYNDKDEVAHLYTLILNPDSTYEVLLDGKVKSSGSIVDHWDFPSKEIQDPALSKPADWVDTKKIPDPAALKPEGYDDIPRELPDPDAEVPEDWDTEEDGEWEPPTIDNPAFKGEWSAPMVDNPAYKGEWEHPVIANPAYAPATYAKFKALTTVGFELWTVNAGSIFDNILVTDDKAYAEKAATAVLASLEGEKEAKEAFKKLTEPEEEADEEEEEDDDEEEDELKDEL
jgi:calreticulin